MLDLSSQFGLFLGCWGLMHCMALQEEGGQGSGKEGEDKDGGEESASPKRIRPNPVFLTNFVSGIKQTNQRLIAESTANAACKVLDTCLPLHNSQQALHEKKAMAFFQSNYFGRLWSSDVLWASWAKFWHACCHLSGHDRKLCITALLPKYSTCQETKNESCTLLIECMVFCQGNSPKAMIRRMAWLCRPASPRRSWFINLMQEMTAVAANGARVLFDRVPESEHKRFRRVALATAAQQNRANCVALLKEVAAHYGYSLDIKEG